MAQDQEQPQDIGKLISNGIRLFSDTVIAPGSSQLLEGKVGSGVARFAVGLAARAVFGPLGWVAVGLDSYSKTTSGHGLFDRISSRRAAHAATPAPATPAPASTTAPVTPAPGLKP